jgi:hypothetical protein
MIKVMQVKCQKCNQQKAEVQMTCSQCGATIMVCASCKSKMGGSPSCHTFGTWKETSLGSSAPHLSEREYFESKQAYRDNLRQKEGSGMHRGTTLPPEEVEVLRLMEDATKHPIAARKKITSAKWEQEHNFTERDGKVVGLIINLWDMAPDYNIIDLITRFESLEQLAIISAKLKLSLEPLTKLPKLTALLYRVTAEAGTPDDRVKDLGKLTQLEELNIAQDVLSGAELEIAIPNLKKLKKLSLYGDRFKDKRILAKWDTLTNLEELDVQYIIDAAGKPTLPAGLENLIALKLLHVNHAQAKLIGGKLLALLQKNNPAVYPPKYKVPSNESEWSQKRPEPLKAGWSGIKVQ